VIDVGSGRPRIAKAVNAANQSEEGLCSSGSAVSLIGAWLATESGITRVRVNGQYVPLLHVSTRQVDAMCPQVASGTPLEFVVETAASESAPFRARARRETPAIFTLDGTGTGQALAFASGRREVAAIRNPRYAAHPARAGEDLLVRTTGWDCDADARSPRLRIGDLTVPVTASRNAALPSVCDVRTTLPAALMPGDAVPLALEWVDADGRVTGSNTVRIAVEPPVTR
jgi:uncharacterized protein (TIGR03437 family)